jgi:putative endonuclease
MLLCSDNSIYCGYTTDLARREAMHNAGSASRCTRSRRPVKLVYYETFATKSEALAREAALKKLKHDAKAKMIEEFRGLLPSEAGPLLYTERLLVHPILNEESDFEEENPKDMYWNADWKISLRYTGMESLADDAEDDAEEPQEDADESIGSLKFSGPPAKGMVEISFEVQEEFAGQGYTTEAARSLIEWAFHQKGVRFIEAEAETKNHAARRVLEKLAFQPCSMGEATVRYRLQLRK